MIFKFKNEVIKKKVIGFKQLKQLYILAVML